MDFSFRPFRDEWLKPGQEAQPGNAMADVPQEEQPSAPVSAALAPAHGGTAANDATSPDKPSARAVLAAARDVQPESLTMAQWLSRELTLPEQLVRQTPKEALEEWRARQLETNPHLAGWAGKSVQNAAHARDNVEHMNRFRDAFAAFDAAYRPQKEQSFAEFMDELGKPGEKLLYGVTTDVPEVAQNMGRIITHGMADWNAAMAGTALAVAENIFGKDSAPARWARSGRDWAEWARPGEVKAESALGQFGYDALRIAPQMAANIAAGVANPAAALGVMGSQIFGSSYNELRKKGVAPLTAAINAGANAAMQTPMERLGLDKMLGAIRATGAWKSLKNLFGAALTEGLTEAAQKAPEFVTHLWAEAERQGSTTGERVDWFAKQVTDADNLLQATREAIYEGLLGSVWGGASGSVGAARSFRQERGKGPGTLPGLLNMPEVQAALSAEAEQAVVMAQRKALSNALTQAADALEGAPAAGDPAALREMTEAVLPEELRQTWIGAADAARLFQEAQARGEDEARALLESLGTDAAGLEQALFQGDVLPVNTATVLTQLTGEGRKSATDALRLTPDGVSGAEAAAYDPEARTEKLVRSVLGMEQEGGESRDVADALADARSAQKVRADVRKEITRITREIENAGYARHAAQTFGHLLEQQALTAHTVYGVDPVTFILQRISVARGEEAEGGIGQAAMYRSPAPNIGKFVEQVRGEAPRSKQSVFVFGNAERPEAGLSGTALELSSDAVRHIDKRHPGFAGWENLEAIVSQGDCYAINPDTKTKNPGRAFALGEGDKVQAILGHVKNGKNGKRYIIETALEGTQKGFAHWLKQKQATPIYQSAGGSPAQPKPTEGRISELERNGLTEEDITSDEAPGNGQENEEAFKGRAASEMASHKNPRVTHDKPLERSLRQELEEVKAASLGQAAMYAARDADLSSFISRAREEAGREKPSYFVLTGEGIPEDAEVRVTSDLVRHQAKRHPDMTLKDNEKLPAIVAGINGENTYQVGGGGAFGTRFKGMQEVDGTSYAYVFDIAPNGTVSFVTFFKDAPEGIRDWFLQPERKKKKASKAPVDPAEAGAHGTRHVTPWQAFERRLSDFIAEVKDGLPQHQEQRLFQTAQATDSAAFKSWFGKSKVVDENGEPLVVYHGTGATVGEDFGFDYKFIGNHGSGEGYGFYFTTDENTAQGYQGKDGSLVKAYLSLQKPMPLKQKPFSKAVLKKILKRAVEKEIEQSPDEVGDYRDSFLSNYANTYELSFDKALNDAVNMVYEADTALQQIAEIANQNHPHSGWFVLAL